MRAAAAIAADMFKSGEAGQATEVVSVLKATLLRSFFMMVQAHSLSKRCSSDIANFIQWLQRLTIKRLGLAATVNTYRLGLPSLLLSTHRLREAAAKSSEKVCGSILLSILHLLRTCLGVVRVLAQAVCSLEIYTCPTARRFLVHSNRCTL